MLANLLRRTTSGGEERALQVTPWGPWQTTAGTAAGVSVNPDSSLQLLTVYGCVTLIADTIATLPRDIFRNRPDGTTEEVTVKPRWFEQPSPTVDIIEFITQTLTSLLLDGNAYWAYTIDGNFAPTAIRVLDPTKVVARANRPGETADPAAGGVEYIVDGAPYRGRLLHIKALTRPGSLKGLSPIESARQSIGLGLGAQEFAGRFYSNGTTMSGVIQTPGDLTQDQAHIMATSFSRDHAGLANAHKPGVLTNGATWQAISITPEQAQFLQSREYQAAEICAQMFLLDPSMLGIASAGTRGQNLTYANLEQRGIHLVQFTLLRWIIRLERAFTLLLPAPQYQKFNVDALIRADLKTRYEAYQIAVGNKPFLKLNEVRDLEDLQPVPGGDKLETTPPKPAPLAVAPTPPVAQPSTNGHRDVKIEHVRAPDVTITNQIVAPTVTKTPIYGENGRITKVVEEVVT